MTLENIKNALNITDAQIEEFETVTTLIKVNETNYITIDELNEVMKFDGTYFTCGNMNDDSIEIKVTGNFYNAELVCDLVKNFKDQDEEENTEELDDIKNAFENGYTSLGNNKATLNAGYFAQDEEGNFYSQEDLEKAIKTYEKQNNCTVLEYTVKEANSNNYIISDVLAEELEEYEEFTIETLTLTK